jgi:hypothetical protein
MFITDFIVLIKNDNNLHNYRNIYHTKVSFGFLASKETKQKLKPDSRFDVFLVMTEVIPAITLKLLLTSNEMI